MAGYLRGNTAILLGYDGTSYAGWQYQTNANTVQAELEKACSELLAGEIRARGASRTDAGVHARGQVASLQLPRPFPTAKLAAAINWNLPPSIRVTAAYQVPADFEPVSWATGKIYRYYVFLRRQPTPIGAKYSWHIPKPLDIQAINREARSVIGSHDFASFQAAGSPVVDTTRNLRHLFCRRRGDWLVFYCVGDGFLYNMVRILIGTLVEFGLGKRLPGEMAAIIRAQDRQAAGATAPAKGLFLEKVLYRPSLDSYSRL